MTNRIQNRNRESIRVNNVDDDDISVSPNMTFQSESESESESERNRKDKTANCQREYIRKRTFPSIDQSKRQPVIRGEDTKDDDDDNDCRISIFSINHLVDDLPFSILEWDALEILDLSEAHNLKRIPRWVGELKNLREIYLPENGTIPGLPDELWNLTNLKVFRYNDGDFQYNDFGIALPPSIDSLSNLKELSIGGVTALPDELGNLIHLETLNLQKSKITSLPESIGNLLHLKHLSMNYSRSLGSLPDSIGNLLSLEALSISHSKIVSIPTSIGNLSNLKEITIEHCSDLRCIPDSFGNLSRLEYIKIMGSGITSLPESLGKLFRLKQVFLDNERKLVALPDSMGGWVHLELLSLNGSGVSSLPTSLGKLSNLKTLHLALTRKLTTLPESIGALTNLHRLSLIGSGIARLPHSIGNLPNLKHVSLDETKSLRQLADGIGQLRSLEYLYLSGPGIVSLPCTHGDSDTERCHPGDDKGPADHTTTSHLRSAELYRYLENLKNLQTLKLDGTLLFNDKSSRIVLSKLVLELPKLGCMGRDHLYSRDTEEGRIISRLLSYNRARYRILSWSSQQPTFPPVALWPMILSRAEVAFASFPWCGSSRCCHCCESRRQSDAMFRLLVAFAPKLFSVPHNGSETGTTIRQHRTNMHP